MTPSVGTGLPALDVESMEKVMHMENSGSPPIQPVDRLPVVIATSVIRSAYQGQSHGGVYLVDLETGWSEQVLDWNDPAIDWSGRGGDRGLRGIAFWGDRVLLAASDEIFVYDQHFTRLGSFRNRYLKHCHEIAVSGDTLHLTSSGFDGILTYDLAAEEFVGASCLRYSVAARGYRNKVIRSEAGRRRLPTVHPKHVRYDPRSAGGPPPLDTVHVNSVACVGDRVFAAGRNSGWLYELSGEQCVPFARIPEGTHNAQPYGSSVVYNHTLADTVCIGSIEGTAAREFPIPSYAPETLENTQLATGAARQGFARGLATMQGGRVAVGSSPATISVFDTATGQRLRSVNLTMDVRNAVHGLEVWPHMSVRRPEPTAQRRGANDQ